MKLKKNHRQFYYRFLILCGIGLFISSCSQKKKIEATPQVKIVKKNSRALASVPPKKPTKSENDTSSLNVLSQYLSSEESTFEVDLSSEKGKNILIMDTINIENKEITLSSKNKKVFQCQPGYDQTAFSLSNSKIVLSNVEIKNCTIGIYLKNGSSLKLINSKLVGNKKGIEAVESSVTLESKTEINNSKEFGVLLTRNSSLSTKGGNIKFLNNSGKTALFISSGKLFLNEGVTLKNNSTKSLPHGGAITLVSSSLTSNGKVIFRDNDGPQAGGILASHGSSVQLNVGTKFYNNSADSTLGAGAIVLRTNSTLETNPVRTPSQNILFAKNISNYSGGGAISARENSTLKLKGSLIFSKNISNGGAEAGAIYLSGNSSLETSGRIIFNENMGTIAGAIFSIESKVQLGAKTTFIKNLDSEYNEDKSIYLRDSQLIVPSNKSFDKITFDENEDSL